MKLKSKSIFLFVIFLVTNVAVSQINSELTSDQKKFLINSWYESPSESNKNIITFRLERHVFQPGVDLVGYEWSEIVIRKDQKFETVLWKWCPEDNQANKGQWSITKNNLILKFETKTCTCEAKILEIEKDKLKLEITQKD